MILSELVSNPGRIIGETAGMIVNVAVLNTIQTTWDYTKSVTNFIPASLMAYTNIIENSILDAVKYQVMYYG